MNETDKDLQQEVLLEKVRELEVERRKKIVSKKENTALLLGENRRLSEPFDEAEAKRRMRAFSRRGFLVGGAAAVFGYLGYSWLRDPENASVFTRTFRLNEEISRLYYSPRNLAPEFPRDQIGPPRINGAIGMEAEFDPSAWKMQVLGVANHNSYPQYTDNVISNEPIDNPEAQTPIPGLLLTLDDIKQLPRVEMTTELKCIEGWSNIVNWAGARFSDFAEKFRPQFSRYVSLATPDGTYYVGWDMPSILHPQTLLAYEMNGEQLPLPHGAPLRLVSTTKYGIKQIKRIGRIEFTDQRPADYWAESGYDWYSGH